MSTLSEKSRAAAKEKVGKLMRDPKGRVDASSWTPPADAENGQSQTGPRPVSRRQFRRGGHVVPEGSYTSIRADRKKRATGGNVGNEYEDRDIKVANESRAGTKQIGGMASGGRAHWIAGAIKHPGAPHKSLGVPEGHKIPAKKLEKAEHSKDPTTARRAHLAETLKGMHKATGGRTARASGGRAKKGTTVNIVIAPSGGARPAMPPPPMGAPPGPVGLHQGAPPPAMPPPGAMGAAPPMMRARGGRTSYPIDTGGGGARARLEKIKAYGPL